jgi:hypothetical protein
MPPNHVLSEKKKHRFGVFQQHQQARAFEKRGSQYETMSAVSAYIEEWGDDSQVEMMYTNRNKNTNTTTRHHHKAVGIASARRFLWGDEEEERAIAQMGLGPSTANPPKTRLSLFGIHPLQQDDSKSINLMGGGMDSSSARRSSRIPRAAPPASAFHWALFGKEQPYGDAADSGEAEEYITKNDGTQSNNRCASVLRSFCLSPLIALAIVLAILWITRQMIFDNEDFVQTSKLNEARFDEIHDKLVEYSNPSLLDTVGTPQNNALQWLANQDPANLAATDAHFHLRYVLAVFFFSTSGKLKNFQRPIAGWTKQDHWMTGQCVCKWYGVRCVGDNAMDDEHEHEHIGQVFALNLTSNQVQGTIPLELQTLPGLESIDLSRNKMGGTIPSELALFSSLRDLFLRANRMTGPVPSELGTMTLLRDLHLGENQLSGTIPTELRQATRIRALGLDKNQLNGTIPELASLSSLSK